MNFHWSKLGAASRDSALLAVGAFVVFALRAFIPRGILAALGIAGYFRHLSIEQLIQAGKVCPLL